MNAIAVAVHYGQPCNWWTSKSRLRWLRALDLNLHSTGQLYKGGASTGVFLQVVNDDPFDLAIPGKSFSFSQLRHAQAAGDYLALKQKGMRVARVALDEILNYSQ